MTVHLSFSETYMEKLKPDVRISDIKEVTEIIVPIVHYTQKPLIYEKH